MTRRRSRSSSAPTPRPRRIAGRDPGDRPADLEEPVALEEEPLALEDEEARETERELPVESEESRPEPPDDDAPPRGLAASPTTTRTLLGLLVVLAVATLAGGGYLVWQDRSEGEGSDIPRATEEHPVRVTNNDAQHAVAAAAEAAETIISTSYENYDEQVDEALELMTPEYGQEQYLPTARDSQDGIIESKTEVEVSIRAQGVHRADAQEVQVLLFLNQLVTKEGEDPVLSPYRVLVTMQRTGDGWLVSGLDTK